MSTTTTTTTTTPTSNHSNNENSSVLSYLLSLIGIIPIDQQQQKQQQQSLQTKPRPTNGSCNFLTNSAFIVSSMMVQEDQADHGQEIQDWLGQLSKMALCQILSTAITDYPQVADGIYNRHYEKNYRRKKRISPISSDLEQQLRQIQSQARGIAHHLDNLRPSEQFGRASETAEALQQLIRTLHVQSDQSFLTLFGLIILAQESLSAPSEVRQHVFYHAKFGRRLILEISSVLKNFNYKGGDDHHCWQSLYSDSWLICLQQVCSKLSRYDITWEYRKEYEDVANMAERYFNHHCKY